MAKLRVGLQTPLLGADMKICLVLPYFGKFPGYFSFWLRSCAYNTTIDFLIFTDNRPSSSCPKNVRYEVLSFDEFREKIATCFDFKIALERPYKLCDFKPAYGLALSKYLKGYDFWGHCDCDLIFGDIRKFITDEVLNKYDRILTRGHLTIYRNNDFSNKFFMRELKDVPNWRDVFANPRAFSFDEWGGTSVLWRELAPDRLCDDIFYDDIMCSRKEFVSSQKLRFLPWERQKDYCMFSFSGESGLVRWYVDIRDNIVKSEPSCYVHFQKRPMAVNTSNNMAYSIVPNEFIDLRVPNLKFLRMVACHRLIYWHYLWIRLGNLKRKVLSRIKSKVGVKFNSLRE